MEWTKKYLQPLFSLMIAASLLLMNQSIVSAQSQAQVADAEVSPPLFSDLTWERTENVRNDVHAHGRTLALNGDMYASVTDLQHDNFASVIEYYSSENLQSLGWEFVGGAGLELTYQDAFGRYLTVKIDKCTTLETVYCVNVWQSTETANMPLHGTTADKVVAYNKKTPSNGASIPLPVSTYQLLTWGDAQAPSTDRYQYCIDQTNNSQCDGDNWITRNSLYSGPGEFTVQPGNTYYWQVRLRDNGLQANGGAWWSFTVTTGYPIVKSITRAIPTSSVTNASAVAFTVIFDRVVTGVDASDFALTTTGGVAGASVGEVGGSGTTYTVLVLTGTGSGTIRLDLVDNDTIKDSQNIPLGGVGVGNGNFNLGQIYTIDKTPPTVVSSVPSLTVTPGIITFAVTFSENVTGVNIADFTLTTTGSVNNAQITGVTGASPGSVYTVTVNTGGIGSGTIRLNVIDDDSIKDVAGNPLGGEGAGNGNFTTGTVFNKTTFADVPSTGFAYSQIEAIYTAGITGGCNAAYYCPGSPVTRAQMAIFLLRGIEGPGYSPPAATGTEFGDVPSNAFAAAWIEELADRGITGGCGGGNYCPNATVTRSQMAIFLLRAKYGSAYNPPAATGTLFDDVPSTAFAAAWIEKLVDDGISAGCGGNNYCPNSSVTRAQMAIFLQRTFNLPLP